MVYNGLSVLFVGDKPGFDYHVESDQKNEKLELTAFLLLDVEQELV